MNPQRVRPAGSALPGTLKRGVAAVEMAVCLPLLTIFSLGAIETANVIYLKQALVQVAYEGARAGMQSSATAADVTTRCNEIITSRGLINTTIVVTPTTLSSTTASGTQITVTVSAPANANAISPVWFFSTAVMKESVVVTRL